MSQVCTMTSDRFIIAAASAEKVRERISAVPVERAGHPPRCDVGRGRVGESDDRIIVAGPAGVLTDGLTLVHECEHPGGADQVLERGPHVPLRAWRRQRE